MRLRLLALSFTLAASASAQVSADSLARLDAEIARTEAALDDLDHRVQVSRDTLSALRTMEDALDAERIAFQDQIRAYQDDAAALRERTAEVHEAYERLRAGGGSEAAQLAYERDVAALNANGARLGAEARQLNAWQDDLNARYRLHAVAVREAAEAGRALTAERRRLTAEAESLAVRRVRLGASQPGR